MKSYLVEIVRTGYGFRQIEILAESEVDAQELALKEAGNYLFSEKDADYQANNVQEIK